jgi:hypothetical protein
MKNLTFLSLSIMLITTCAQNKNSFYEKAENYLRVSAEVKEYFAEYISDTTNINFCVAEEFVSLNRTFLLDEFVEYFYINENQTRKKEIKDSLYSIDIANMSKRYKNEYFESHASDQNCDLFLVFSPIVDNTLYAELLYSNVKSLKYDEIIKYSIVGIELLFVFNKKNIVKVFSKNVSF